jgi:hypothetical protein
MGHINDFHRRAITCLDFSPDGTLLASVGSDDDNSVAVHGKKKKFTLRFIFLMIK